MTIIKSPLSYELQTVGNNTKYKFKKNSLIMQTGIIASINE